MSHQILKPLHFIDKFIEMTLADAPRKVLDLSYDDGFREEDKLFKELIS